MFILSQKIWGFEMRKGICEGVMIYVTNEMKPNYVALIKQYNCDYRTVKSAYGEEKTKNKKPKGRKKQKAIICVKHLSGRSAHVDWKEEICLASKQGKILRLMTSDM